MNKVYRTDIDGLRAIAIISTIFFHLGYLPNGYLGVDIFFVISGYLITGIISKDVEENKFSVLNFYERRIRRIIPLVLFCTLVSLIIGILFMLPDDLENLSQSIVATYFSSNNILLYITSQDYWAAQNNYKPLMHTWSLGVEEQFYLIYPFIFFFFKGSKRNLIFPVLILLTIFSLMLFFYTNNNASKFYFLQFRFFELSIGGICAIYFKNKFISTAYPRSHYLLFSSLIFIILILYFNLIESNDFKILTISIITSAILVLGGVHFQSNGTYKFLLSNKIIVGVGKISFSLYMWHQIVFAFSRYFIFEEITTEVAILLLLITLILSVISYYLIETPFRNRLTIKTKRLLITIGIPFFIILGTALYINSYKGILKYVPELELSKPSKPEIINSFSSLNDKNKQYNEAIEDINSPFSKSKKIKILVVGDSFARDFSNIILESSFKEIIELSYLQYTTLNIDNIDKFHKADFIFYSTLKPPSTKENVLKSLKNFEFEWNKLWIVGIKDFGKSNGIFYNRKNTNCQEYRTNMKKGILEINNQLRGEWNEKYIDIISLIIDSNDKVLVFTPECKFISHDTYHLTKYGAKFFADLLNSKLTKIFKSKSKRIFK